MLIAYDAAGMSEAVGTLYEAAAALDPLMGLDPPSVASIAAADKPALCAPEAKIAWRAVVGDRPLSIKVSESGEISVLTSDGSVTTIDKTGKVSAQRPSDQPAPLMTAPPAPKVPAELTKGLMPNRLPKYMQAQGESIAVGYWGGGVDLFKSDGAIKCTSQLPHDVSALAWLSDRLLLVGQSDGTVVAIVVR